jgi:hypothetical protein
MNSNKIVNLNLHQRHQFDPSSKDDLRKARIFFHTMSWGPAGCPFNLEWPYEDIPYMLKTKITEYFLKGLK